MKRLYALALTFVVLCIGCPSTPKYPPSPSADCLAVCKHLTEMTCEKFTPAGKPCSEWLCQAHGVKLDCLAKATTCEEANKVQEKGCP
jgi:hypothetical protein